jgi:hypothetical protein
MARRFGNLVAPLLLICAPSAASAQFSIAPRIGTLGLGVDVGYALAPMVTARAGAGFIPVEPRGTFDDTEYQVSIPSALTLGMDLHPGGGSFRLSGGLLIQSGALSIEGTPTGNVELGDDFYTPAEVGTLRGEIAGADVAPFLAFGFGRHGTSGVGLFLDLGGAFMGDPTVSLSASGEARDDPDLQAGLRAEEAHVREDVDLYGRFYPIVSLGIRIGLGHGSDSDAVSTTAHRSP